MATSNSVNFVLTRNEIVSDAYSHIGHLDEGEILSGEREAYGVRQLNKMMKAWVAKGQHVFTTQEGLLPLVASTSSYTIGPTGTYVINRPNRILSARWRDSSSNDTPIWKVSREEYFSLPNKSNEGKPTQFYYDRQLTNGVMFVWPTPDSSLDKIAFTYEDTIQDFDSNANDTPFPSEWSDALTWNLAMRLCGRENVDLGTFQMVKLMADELLKDVLDYNDEYTELQFFTSYR